MYLMYHLSPHYLKLQKNLNYLMYPCYLKSLLTRLSPRFLM
jgi:hypothetical protein